MKFAQTTFPKLLAGTGLSTIGRSPKEMGGRGLKGLPDQ